MKIIAWNVYGLRSLLKTDHLNQLINDETQYIFAEYLTIPISPIIIYYKDIDIDLNNALNFDSYNSYNSINTSQK